MKTSLEVLSVALLIVFSLTVLPLEAIAMGLEASDEQKPHVDPFKVLIKEEKKVRSRPVRKIQPVVKTGPPPVPPLRLKLTAIAGEHPNFVAVISYKNQDHIVEKGWESPDNVFKVRNIFADKVEVFYSRAKSVKTFFF